MIKCVLWDIDGTLLNFKKAQYVALYKCFAYFDEHLDDLGKALCQLLK